MKLTPEIIRICRINLDITQGKLARTVGISGAYLGSIERGERHLPEQVAQRIRKAFNVDDAEIMRIVEANRKLNQKTGE